MAGESITYPQLTVVPEDAGSRVYRRKLPLLRVCPALPYPFVKCGEEWNCNLCPGESPYFIPFGDNDVIPFQLNLLDQVNIDPNNLQAGFETANSTSHYISVCLINPDTQAPIIGFETVDTFSSEYWVGYDAKKGSYQTWFLNTSLLPIDLKCFAMKVKLFRINPDTNDLEQYDEICSEPFKREFNCRENTFTIESEYNTTDCFNRCYKVLENTLGNADTAFYNFWRFRGVANKYIGNSTVKNLTDNDVEISKEIIENYRLKINLSPPYIAKALGTITCGQRVLVNSESYTNFSDIGEPPKELRSFVSTLDYQKVCEVKSYECN